MLGRLTIAAALALGSLQAHAAPVLTDLAIFSSNAEGNQFGGLLWNTQGKPADGPDRWNLYVSRDPLGSSAPTFVNGFNDARTQIALPLGVGLHTFSIFAESVGQAFDPAQFFAVNMYFGGVQSAPAISGAQNLDNNGLVAVGHPNGPNIFGTGPQAGAGTLTALIDGYQVTLESFTWNTDRDRDVVWPHWANDPVYASGSGTADFYGTLALRVTAFAVPEPGSLALVLAALGVAGVVRRRPGRTVRAPSS